MYTSNMGRNYADSFPLASAFDIDDKLNQIFADWYGIVMGTSHEEPMMRSIPVEWGLFGVGEWDYSSNQQFIYNFWVNSTERSDAFENVFTVGMRGDGDCEFTTSIMFGLMLMEYVSKCPTRALASTCLRRSSRTSVRSCPRSTTLPTSRRSLKFGVSVGVSYGVCFSRVLTDCNRQGGRGLLRRWSSCPRRRDPSVDRRQVSTVLHMIVSFNSPVTLAGATFVASPPLILVTALEELVFITT